MVSEGAKPKGGEMVIQGTRNNGLGVDNTKLGGIGQVVAKQLEEITGLEARNTTLGYMQRVELQLLMIEFYQLNMEQKQCN